MRHWLRVLHAVLREGPVRTSVHDLVAQLEARLDDERVSNTLLPEGGRHCQEGGQTKRRKYLNYFHTVRLRLQDLEEEDGEDGVNQHAVIERLRATIGDIRAARDVLETLTREQGGQQLLSAHGGLDQAEAAVEHAHGEAHNGDFDWLAPGWGAAVCCLLGDAEDLVEEEEALNLVHPADVLAMADGAEDATLPTGGNLAATVPKAALLTNLEEELFRPITVDSQATEEGEQSLEGPLFGPALPWVPPLGTEQSRAQTQEKKTKGDPRCRRSGGQRMQSS